MACCQYHLKYLIPNVKSLMREMIRVQWVFVQHKRVGHEVSEDGGISISNASFPICKGVRRLTTPNRAKNEILPGSLQLYFEYQKRLELTFKRSIQAFLFPLFWIRILAPGLTHNPVFNFCYFNDAIYSFSTVLMTYIPSLISLNIITSSAGTAIKSHGIAATRSTIKYVLK